MKALSIKQPWAWLICAGIPQMKAVNNPDSSQRVELTGMAYIKDIENRNWKIGRNSQHGPYKSESADFQLQLPARIYVHAGKTFDNKADTALLKMGFSPMLVLSLFSNRVFRGGIIGEVDIVECVTESKSTWFTGKYGFVLANPILYNGPIPCRGRLGFFTPDVKVYCSGMNTGCHHEDNPNLDQCKSCIYMSLSEVKP
ncbi:MAG: hypothetical protein JW967_01595 [Dehalococcoidales bacterium]|nr:hypothetical protein [Dehalococcoidales bacterium]